MLECWIVCVGNFYMQLFWNVKLTNKPKQNLSTYRRITDGVMYYQRSNGRWFGRRMHPLEITSGL